MTICRNFSIGILAGLIFILFSACNSMNDYKNSSLSIEERVQSLLKQMTLEEKISQMSTCADIKASSDGRLDTSGLYSKLSASSGVIYLKIDLTAEKQALLINEIQKFINAHIRLGIPAFIFGEGLHGFVAPEATSFPQAIGMGCTWDTTLIRKIYSSIAIEMRSRGYNQALSPVVDLSREPRWGRTEETWSEDPYLVSRYAVNAVKGFQGESFPIDKHHVVATLKHFAGHGQPEGGRNCAAVDFPERIFRENHLYPFEKAVKEGKVQCIMPSYNEWDGIPNHANHKLLVSILREEWKYNGLLISDLGAVYELKKTYSVAADSIEAARLAVTNGVNIELSEKNKCYASLALQVKKGIIDESVIDKAVAGILRVKFLAGLFENPYADLTLMKKVTQSKEHISLALKAAHESMVLLKNQGNLLPLDSSKIKNIAVIGPNAADIHLGGYSYEPRSGISVLDGIKEFAKGRFSVRFAQGCFITKGYPSFWHSDSVQMSDPETDAKLIKEAIKVARFSDMILLVLGENEATNREAWSEAHLGDRDNLDLIGRQEKLARQLISTGKPVIVLLLNGRPLSINYLAKTAPAIIEGWYLGQETGRAVADVLFGKVNPSGKLSTTFPRSVGQLPCYYNHKPSRYRSYLFSDSSPLFPFGFGLSYTTFSYSNITLEKKSIHNDEMLKAFVSVTNTGNKAGDEIVQLYIHDKVASVSRPVMELKDFSRISLLPGQTKKVTFLITPEKLMFYNDKMIRTSEKGKFEVFIGPNSRDVKAATFDLE